MTPVPGAGLGVDCGVTPPPDHCADGLHDTCLDVTQLEDPERISWW